jgi:hypothetical protein
MGGVSVSLEPARTAACPDPAACGSCRDLRPHAFARPVRRRSPAPPVCQGVDQEEAAAMFVSAASLLYHRCRRHHVPDLQHQTVPAGEHPEDHQGHMPVDVPRVPVGIGRCLDRIGNQFTRQQFGYVFVAWQVPLSERAPHMCPSRTRRRFQCSQWRHLADEWIWQSPKMRRRTGTGALLCTSVRVCSPGYGAGPAAGGLSVVVHGKLACSGLSSGTTIRMECSSDDVVSVQDALFLAA